LAERARASLGAGCDVVLHCNGSLDQRHETADACPPLSGEALRRSDAALRMRRTPAPFDLAAAHAEFAATMAGA
jgi:beta-N-acetylhexosaminidase